MIGAAVLAANAWLSPTRGPPRRSPRIDRSSAGRSVSTPSSPSGTATRVTIPASRSSAEARSVRTGPSSEFTAGMSWDATRSSPAK
ncbi:MAG TPA: hypothetical protein VN408_15410 [Actinoplanes sp.]|nr:hypothetical protein [Actinoplanes sp.]